jgi:hypothetical protein
MGRGSSEVTEDLPPARGRAARSRKEDPPHFSSSHISGDTLEVLWESLEDEGYFSSDHADFVEAGQYLDDSSSPLWKEEILFHKRHGIENMLEGLEQDELPEDVKKILEDGREYLTSLGINTDGFTPQEVFQMWRFWDAWNSPSSGSHSEKTLREAIDPLDICQRAKDAGDLESVNAATVYLEALRAGHHSNHYRQLDEMIRELDGSIRDRLEIDGRRPQGLLLAIPSSRWVPSHESYFSSGAGIVATNGFEGRRESFADLEVSVISLDELRQTILYATDGEEIHNEDTGEIREDLLHRPLPEDELRERVEHVGQHELIHDMQIVTDYEGMPDEDIAIFASLTEGLTEELNIRKFQEHGMKVSETSYHNERAGLLAVLREAQIPEKDQTPLIEKLNLMTRSESLRVLEELLAKAGANSFREVWERAGAGGTLMK